jgi:hypothetical protein
MTPGQRQRRQQAKTPDEYEGWTSEASARFWDEGPTCTHSVGPRTYLEAIGSGPTTRIWQLILSSDGHSPHIALEDSKSRPLPISRKVDAEGSGQIPHTHGLGRPYPAGAPLRCCPIYDLTASHPPDFAFGVTQYEPAHTTVWPNPVPSHPTRATSKYGNQYDASIGDS